MKYMGTDDKDTGMVGRQPMGLRNVLQGGGVGGSPVWVVDVGD